MSQHRIAATALVLPIAALFSFGFPSLALGQEDVARMKAQYVRPPVPAVENPPLAALGRELFFDPQISASGKTACASCHFPELGWVVTDARSRNDSGKLTSRKSQPLIGLGHSGNAPVGWDGRSATLEAQAKASIATGSMSMRETDTPVKVETIEERIKTNPAYVAKFSAALPGAPINIDSIAQAIAAFERTIEPDTAPFDRWIAGDDNAISERAKRGFVLFNGKATCFVYTGWRFTDDRFHDIGTDDRSGARTQRQGRPADAVCVQDPDIAFGGLASALHAQRIGRHPVRYRPALREGRIDRPSRSPLMLPFN